MLTTQKVTTFLTDTWTKSTSTYFPSHILQGFEIDISLLVCDEYNSARTSEISLWANTLP